MLALGVWVLFCHPCVQGQPSAVPPGISSTRDEDKGAKTTRKVPSLARPARAPGIGGDVAPSAPSATEPVLPTRPVLQDEGWSEAPQTDDSNFLHPPTSRKNVMLLILLGMFLVAWAVFGRRKTWGLGTVFSVGWRRLTGRRVRTDWPADAALYQAWFGGEQALWLSLDAKGRLLAAGGPLAARLQAGSRHLGVLADAGSSAKLITAFRSARYERRPQHVEFSLRTADGRCVPVSGSVGPRDAIFRDVSAERSLPATLAWAVALGDQASGAVLVENGAREIVYLNSAARRLFNLPASTAGELIGATSATLWSQSSRPADEPLRRQFARDLDETFMRGQPVRDRCVVPAEATEWGYDYQPLPAAGLHIWTFRESLQSPRPAPLTVAPRASPVPASLPPASLAVQPAKWQEKAPVGAWCPDGLHEHLPLEVADTLYKNGYALAGPAAAGWTLLGATRRGRLHAHHGTHREDAFRWRNGDGFTVAAVSDGAGSATLSRLGSETACHVVITTLHEQLTAQHTQLSAASGGEFIQSIGQWMQEAVRAACQALQDAAAASGHPPEDFRCTLLLAALHERVDGTGQMLISQVGDGCVGVLRADGSTQRLAEPDSGEFSGQVTCFLPEAEAVIRAGRIRPVALSDVEALVLCTDGIEDPFFPVERRLPELFHQMYAGVNEPLSGFDGQPVHGPVIGAGAASPDVLEEWLKFEKRGENDDRTILLLHRDPARLTVGQILPAATPAAGAARPV